MKPQNQADSDIAYTDDEIATLQNIQDECRKQFKDAARWLKVNQEKEELWNWPTAAAQQTAIATNALAYMEATDRLKKAKPGPK